MIVLAGPDGAGKSAVAAELIKRLSGERETAHLHWRPGLLPAPSALFGRESGPTTAPHGAAPRNPVISAMLRAYYWLDYFMGWMLRLRRVVRRGGVIIAERWWWDMLADPHRYRMSGSMRIWKRVSTVLPAPEWLFVLGGEPEEIMARKQEISLEETIRQLLWWRNFRPGATKTVIVDVTDATVDDVSTQILSTVRETW